MRKISDTTETAAARKRWRISEIARAFHLSADALRYYEKERLLRAHKDLHNGYRYYQYDDIIQIMDILFYRDLNLPIKDIRSIMSSMDLLEVEEALRKNETLAREKIRELQFLAKRLKTTIARYEQCRREAGRFSIVQAPPIRYKFMESGDDILNLIRDYHSLRADSLQDLRYAIRIPISAAARGEGFAASEMGIGVMEEDAKAAGVSSIPGLTAFLEGEYLYTVASTNYEAKKNLQLKQAVDWMKANGKRAAGDLIGCYAATSHRERLDFYEVWIPIA